MHQNNTRFRMAARPGFSTRTIGRGTDESARRRNTHSEVPDAARHEKPTTSSTKTTSRKAARSSSSVNPHPAHKKQSRSMVLNRNTIQRKKIKKRSSFKNNNATVVMIGLVVVNVLFGGLLLRSGVIDVSSGKDKLVSVDLTSKSENDVLARTTSGTAAAPMFPSLVAFPEDQAVSRIELQGLDSEGNLMYPDSPGIMAWFERSAKPLASHESATLLFARNSPSIENPFIKSVLSAVKGGTLELTLVNGEKMFYEIVEKKVLSQGPIDFEYIMSNKSKGSPALNILIENTTATSVHNELIFAVAR